MSKILVTGGAGFIGSNLTNHLQKEGHNVVALDNLLLGKKENLLPEVAFVEGSVESEEVLEKCGNDFDYIVHLAASSSAPMFQEDLIGSCKNNIFGYLSILEYARKIGAKKVLYASTSSIYGNNPTPLTEDQHVVPPNYYSVTKHTMEEISHVYARQFGLEIIGFRFMSIYGLNEKHKGIFANLVSQFIWEIEKGNSPILYGDGTQRRDFTSAKDVAQAICKAMETEKRFGSEIFNVGTTEDYSLIELVEFINKAFGKSIPPKFIENPVKEGYIKVQKSSIDKISRELKYEPTVSLEEGIREIVENL